MAVHLRSTEAPRKQRHSWWPTGKLLKAVVMTIDASSLLMMVMILFNMAVVAIVVATLFPWTLFGVWALCTRRSNP